MGEIGGGRKNASSEQKSLQKENFRLLNLDYVL